MSTPPTCSQCGLEHWNFQPHGTKNPVKAPITSFRELGGTGFHDWHNIPGPKNAGFGQPLPDMGNDIFTRKDKDG